MRCARFGCPDLAACDGLCPACWTRRNAPTPIRETKVHPTLEDALWMRETGESMEIAARRLGIKFKSLERLMIRHGLTWERSAA